jgi:hypothetical protein
MQLEFLETILGLFWHYHAENAGVVDSCLTDSLGKSDEETTPVLLSFEIKCLLYGVIPGLRSVHSL